MIYFLSIFIAFLLQLEDGNNADIECSGNCFLLNWKGDNKCDDQNNNCGCDWDGGDCCGSNVNTQYCSACECLEVEQIAFDYQDFLSIHNGGSDDSEMVAKLTGQMNDTKIAIPGNQIFVVFHTNEEIARKGFHALIMESKNFDDMISCQKLEIMYFH